jgi:hypothetical protein
VRQLIRKCGRLGLGLLVGLLACAPGEAIEASRRAVPGKGIRPRVTSVDTARIHLLISQLGSEQFAEREAADRELARYGARALPALRRAANSPDAEVRQRARDLIRRIMEKAEPPARGPDGKPLPLYWDGR